MVKRRDAGDLPSYEGAESSSSSSSRPNSAIHAAGATAVDANENQSQRPLEKTQTTGTIGSSKRPSQLFSADNYYGVNEADDETVDASSEDDLDVPPAYSSGTYGHLFVDAKSPSGIGTDVRVTNDGRVNIRIEQRSPQLAEVVLPALQAQLEVVQQDQPQSAYIPPSLGSDGQSRPPPMNVVIHVVGSRGDVQPFIALGKVLKGEYGHRVRLATHPTFKKSVEENGLEFFSIGGDPAELMAFMVKNPGLMLGLRGLRRGDISRKRKQVAEMMEGCWRSCIETGDRSGIKPSNQVVEDWLSETGQKSLNSGSPFVADVIIANPPSFAHVHCAEKLGIPLHMMFTMPWSPTQIFPHPLANIQSSNADTSITNYMSYVLVDMLTWQGLGTVINRFRVHLLQLEPIHLMSAPGMLERMRIPYTYCWSPSLVPKPADWARNISISGFYFLELASNYNPDANLLDFLRAGPPPVYIGFGSIVVDDPDTMTTIIFKAVRKAGVRALVSKGGAGLGSDKLEKPDGVFILGNVPHDWLFQRVSCVVHHGGAGTTAAGIQAGRPTVVVPFSGDQPFWGAMVARAGAGPDPIPHEQLTADNLAEAITEALKPTSLERAKELAEMISGENGSDAGAQHFHQMLELDKLRCSLLPNRAAAWRVKRTQIRLSPLAAHILAEKRILSYRDLKLYRPKEYNVKRTAMNPLLGGSTAVLNTLGSIAKGLTDIPLNLVQGLFGFYSTGSGDYYRTRSSAGVDIAMGTGKSLSRIIGSAIKSPMDITLAMSKGFHHMPSLYGDEVRDVRQVTGVKSGMITAGKEFGLGVFDGITGIFSQPVKGAMKEGPVGFVKGVGKGLAGAPLKSAAGAIALPAYTMKGFHSEAMKRLTQTTEGHISSVRKAQGLEEWRKADRELKNGVVHEYLGLLKETKKMRRVLRDRESDVSPGAVDDAEKPYKRRNNSLSLRISRLKVKGKKRESTIGDSSTNADSVVTSPDLSEDLVSPLSDSRDIYEMPANEEPLSPALQQRGSTNSIHQSEDNDSELYAYSTTEQAETETTNAEDILERNSRLSRESRQSTSCLSRYDDEDHSRGHAISSNAAKQRIRSIDKDQEELEDEEIRRAARLHRETIERMPSEKESVSEVPSDIAANQESDEEERLTRAIEESQKINEEYERERQEEQIVIEYVKKLSLAEAEFRRKMSSTADGAAFS